MEDSDSSRELHGKSLIGYLSCYGGVFLSNLLGGIFAVQFYVYTINLDFSIVSVGVFLQLFLTALCSIIFGIVIDNKKPGRFGKRRPFLLYGLPIWVLSSIILWIPPSNFYCAPANSFNIPTIIFLWSFLILKSVSGILILIAIGSMFPEQSQTLKNREKISSIQTIISIVASILALLLPLIVQSMLVKPKEAKWWTASGQLVLFFIPIIAIIFVSFGIIGVFAAFFTIDESFHVNAPTQYIKKKSIKATIQHMKKPILDEKFRKFVLVGFYSGFSGKIIGLVLIPFLTYVMLFVGAKYLIYIIISISCKFGWFLFWKKLINNNRDLIKLYSTCLFTMVIASILELFFLVQLLSFEFKVVLFIISYGTILGSMYAVGLFGGPISGALIDEAADKLNYTNKLEAVSEISGAYAGFSSFMVTVSPAIASIIVGFILTGNNESNPYIITLCLSSTAFFYFLAWLYIRQIKLTKKL